MLAAASSTGVTTTRGGGSDAPPGDLPRDENGEIDWVTVASMESFPASDAPAWPSARTMDAPREANPDT
jgi:hypothetical protein